MTSPNSFTLENFELQCGTALPDSDARLSNLWSAKFRSYKRCSLPNFLRGAAYRCRLAGAFGRHFRPDKVVCNYAKYVWQWALYVAE